MEHLSFISHHEGFYGTIKNEPKDFIVVEIDTRGQFANSLALNYGQNVSQPPEDVCSESKPSEPVNTSSVDPCSDLHLILGPDLSKDLEEFTNKLRDGAEHKHMEFSLGSFPDKNIRAGVHRAVRQTFPFLQTITSHSEIRVREDPDFRELSALTSEEEAENFLRFVDAKAPGSIFTFLPDDSKEHRTSIHHFISRRFGKLVESKSFSGQQTTSITVRLREKSRNRQKRRMDECEEELSLYTAFILKKNNQETLESISLMAVVLDVLPSDFTYAGIKDKKAITYQTIVVKKVSPDRLLEKVPDLEKKGLELSHIRSVSEPLKLGRLQGNHFSLLIRDLKPHEMSSCVELNQLVQEAVKNVKTRGFVNYYGPQRFGRESSVRADQVGLALLKEEMEASIKLFFTPEDNDNLHNKAKQHFLDTGNAKESLALMPAYKARERLVLRALHRYGTGPQGCARGWLSLPHSTRIFYLHSYCSRVWNQAASFRLQALGFRPVRGDLVWCGSLKGLGDPTEISAQQVHIVTAEEEKDGVFSLQQVVLPMPGNSVKYPENQLGQWYRDRLAGDGLDSCRFRLSQLKLNVPGCYRLLLARPQNVHYRLLSEDHLECLSLTFDLDASCYATVCLREIMKCNVS